MTCGWCRSTPPGFDRARSFGEYRGALAQSIRKFKYNGHRLLAPTLGGMITAADRQWLDEVEATLVIPVPLHPTRLRERGFNQAVDLARPVARERELPLTVDAVARIRDTAPQFGLTVVQRKQNVKGAFAAKKPELLQDQTIILVDDVMTTGATAAECCRTLKDAGAKMVAVLTLARTT